MKRKLAVILSFFAGAVAGGMAGAGIAHRMESKKTDKERGYAKKHLALYLMMNQWVKVKQKNKSLIDYMEKHGYRDVAIYGMNYVGETLAEEFAGSGISVKYGIDKNTDNIYSDMTVLAPDDALPEVDAVIITAITFYDEIEEQLSKKMDCPILSLEDILFEI